MAALLTCGLVNLVQRLFAEQMQPVHGVVVTREMLAQLGQSAFERLLRRDLRDRLVDVAVSRLDADLAEITLDPLARLIVQRLGYRKMSSNVAENGASDWTVSV
jgi:hypothetical protein